MRFELWPVNLWLGSVGILYVLYLLLDIYRLRRIIRNQRHIYRHRKNAHYQQQHSYDAFRDHISRRLTRMGKKTPE